MSKKGKHKKACNKPINQPIFGKMPSTGIDGSEGDYTQTFATTWQLLVYIKFLMSVPICFRRTGPFRSLISLPDKRK